MNTARKLCRQKADVSVWVRREKANDALTLFGRGTNLRIRIYICILFDRRKRVTLIYNFVIQERWGESPTLEVVLKKRMSVWVRWEKANSALTLFGRWTHLRICIYMCVLFVFVLYLGVFANLEDVFSICICTLTEWEYIEVEAVVEKRMSFWVCSKKQTFVFVFIFVLCLYLCCICEYLRWEKQATFTIFGRWTRLPTSVFEFIFVLCLYLCCVCIFVVVVCIGAEKKQATLTLFGRWTHLPCLLFWLGLGPSMTPLKSQPKKICTLVICNL